MRTSKPPKLDNPPVADQPSGTVGGRGDIEQRETDILETMSADNPSIPDAPRPSANSDQDAGLAEPVLNAAGDVVGQDEEWIGSDQREIPMTDLEEAPEAAIITSPEMADMSSPGEVDIEALDEDAANDFLPLDAQLDHLEP